MRILICLMLFASAAFAQNNQVTAYPPRYHGSLASFLGKPTKSVWSSRTITPSVGARYITIDNTRSLDTLWFGFSAADTINTKRYRLMPGEIANEWWSFTSDITFYWRAVSDTSMPISWVIR